MQNKHKLFGLPRWSLAERRVIGFAGDPEVRVPSSPEDREKFAENKKLWEKVFDYLRDAPQYEDDAELKEFIGDKRNLRRVAAVVELPGDDTVDWLPKIAQKFSPVLRKRLEQGEEATMKRLREDLRLAAEEFSDELSAAPDNIDGFNRRLQKRADVTLPNSTVSVTELPGGEQTADLLRELDDLDDRVLRDRQYALLDIAREVIRRQEISVDTIDEIVPVPSEIANKLRGTLSAQVIVQLKETLNDYAKDHNLNVGDAFSEEIDQEHYQAVKKELLDVLVRFSKLRLVGPEPQITGSIEEVDQRRVQQLKTSRDTARSTAEQLDQYESGLLNGTEYERSRDEFFAWIAGGMPDALLANLDADTNAFDTGAFAKALNLDKDAVEAGLSEAVFGRQANRKAVPNIRALLIQANKTEYQDITDQQIVESARQMLRGETITAIKKDDLNDTIKKLLLTTWNAGQFLEDLGVTSNQLTSSLSNIVLRSYLGKESTDLLMENNLGSLSFGTMIELAYSDGISITDKTIKPSTDLLKMLGKKEDENYVLNKDHFLEVFSFLLMKKADAGRSEAETLWKEVIGSTKDSNVVKVSEEHLKTTIESKQISDDAKIVLEQIKTGDIKHKTFADQIADISMESFGTVSTGAGKWWQMLKDMPRFYADPQLTEQLLAIDDKRLALDGYADMIDGILESAETNGVEMKQAIADLKTLQATQDEAVEPLEIAEGAIMNVEQAYLLTKVSQDIITNELDDLNWSLLPEDVQNIAFWIAMKSGRAEDKQDKDRPATSIAEARQFLRDYQNPDVSETMRKTIASKVKPDASLAELLIVFSPEDREKFAQYDLQNPAQLTELKQAYVEAFLRNVSAAELRRVFVSDFIAHHPNALELRKFLITYDQFEEASGENILDVISHKHGISVRPMALQALMGRYQSETIEQSPGETRTTAQNKVIVAERVGRWLIDRDGTPQQQEGVRNALNIVLDGPVGAKQATIEAFITQQDVTYHLVPGDKGMVMTAVEATDIVRRVQTHLKRLATERQTAHETLDDFELYNNPLESGLRAGINTLKELWAGDSIDKLKAAGAVVAAVYLIRKALSANSESSLAMKAAKWSVIGVPLLIVANSVVKNRTGRDYMGEMLKFMPKDQQASALERFRRRSTKEERYEFLGTNAGHEAMRQLSGPESTVEVKDLIEWRHSVQSSTKSGEVGHNVYSVGAPDIDVTAIQMQLGPDATEEEAYKVAYYAFEALLVDVASLRDFSGSLDERAERGADIVRSQYVDFLAYRDRPDLLAKMKARHITMLDVIISESQTPENLDVIAEDRKFMEYLVDATGWTADVIKGKGVQFMTTSKLYFQRTGEMLPSIKDSLWSGAEYGVENIYDFWRAVKPRLQNDLPANIDAAWDTFVDMLSAVGIAIEKGVPGAVEYTLDAGADLTNFTLDTAVRLYREARRHNTIGNVTNGLESLLQGVFGANVADLLAMRANVKSNLEYVEQISDYDAFVKGLRNNLSSVASIEELNDDDDTAIKAWLSTSTTALGLGDSFDTADLNPYERMAVYEHTKRKLYALVAAERIDDIQGLNPGQRLDYPITIDNIDWMSAEKGFELASDIERTYGINTLSLIGLEHDLAGAYQRWVAENTGGVVRAPLDFVHWVIDFGTFDNATDHLLGDIELYRDQFMSQAEERFKNDPKKSEKLRLYGMYLETILTNVAMEAAMGMKNAKQIREGETADTHVFTLASDQAMELLDYIDTLRSSSADPSKLDRLQLSAFESFGAPKGPNGDLNDVLDDADLMRRIQSARPDKPLPTDYTVDVPGIEVPEVLSPNDVDNAQEFVEKAPEHITLAELEQMLELLPGMEPKLRDQVRERFDGVAEANDAQLRNDSEGLAKPENRQLAYALLRGVGSFERRANLRAKLVEYYTTADTIDKRIERMQELADERKEMPAEQLREVQHLLSRSVHITLSDMADDMIKAEKYSFEANKDKVVEQRHEKFAKEIDQLTKLYQLTNRQPDMLSDTALLMIEHLLYFGKDNLEADDEGRTGFEKFKAFMKEELGVENIPEQYDYEANDRSLPGSIRRMNDDFSHHDSEGDLPGWLDINLFNEGGGALSGSFGRLSVYDKELAKYDKELSNR